MNKTMEVTFCALEYNSDTSFNHCEYRFVGNEEKWSIFRRTDSESWKEYLSLPSGYELVKVELCGICSTDLSRHFLPFPLPQITGHEVVGHTVSSPSRRVAVEINASHQARGTSDSCAFCCNTDHHSYDMNIHCPARVTLGIDRLPGGFAPYLLAPIHSLKDIPKEISMDQAVLVEPFAAALKGVETTPPQQGVKVAVVGPRKLGLLIIAALDGFRKQHKIDFSITAISRHSKMKNLTKTLGCNEHIDTSCVEIESLEPYDIVFDTTGTKDGFELALKICKRVLHLKSTSGAEVFGCHHFTQSRFTYWMDSKHAVVVDEIAIMKFSLDHLHFKWPSEKERHNQHLFVSPNVPSSILDGLKDFQCKSKEGRHPIASLHQCSFEEAAAKILEESKVDGSNYLHPYGRYDIAIVANTKEIDSAIRPLPHSHVSIVRPQGVILLVESLDDKDNVLASSIVARGVQIWTSRCGDFDTALKMMKDNIEITKQLQSQMITHIFDLKKLPEAFQIAKNSQECIKVVVKVQ